MRRGGMMGCVSESSHDVRSNVVEDVYELLAGVLLQCWKWSSLTQEFCWVLDTREQTEYYGEKIWEKQMNKH